MKSLITIILWVPIAVFAQELCEPTSPLKEVQRWGNELNSIGLLKDCEHFGIKDRSILETPHKIPPVILEFYRQNELKLKDPIGDFALTRVSSDNFNTALKNLLGQKSEVKNLDERDKAKQCAQSLFNLEEESNPLEGRLIQYKETKDYEADKALLEELLKGKSSEEKKKVMDRFEDGLLIIESRKSPIDPEKMALEMIQIMEEENKNGLTLDKGQKHQWSEEFKKTKKTISKDSFKAIPSKILSTLSGGRSEALLITGKEKDLRRFIMDAPDQSLTPQDLFRKSYQLNEGNLYLTLLTIENTLSKYWLHPKRQDLKQTNKLKPFGKIFGSQGDVFGHWYHLFGMIYYGYAEGGVMASVAGKTESLGSLVLSGFEGERQENKINMDGGKIGSLLRRYAFTKEKNKDFKFKDKSRDDKEDLKKLVTKEIERIIKE